jgi:hypothetical protein
LVQLKLLVVRQRGEPRLYLGLLLHHCEQAGAGLLVEPGVRPSRDEPPERHVIALALGDIGVGLTHRLGAIGHERAPDRVPRVSSVPPAL